MAEGNQSIMEKAEARFMDKQKKTAERNKATRSELKSRTKTAVRTIGDESNDEAVRIAVKKIDSAASKGIIHKNTAARKKSRLMKKVNAAAS